MTIGPNSTLYGATLGGGEGTCTYDGDSGLWHRFQFSADRQLPRSLPFRDGLRKCCIAFRARRDGGVAFSTVIFDASGNMYGTTVYGGTNSVGTVFKLTPSGGGHYTESVLYDFAGGGNDGQNPLDGVIFDTAGNLYGTTAEWRRLGELHQRVRHRLRAVTFGFRLDGEGTLQVPGS